MHGSPLCLFHSMCDWTMTLSFSDRFFWYSSPELLISTSQLERVMCLFNWKFILKTRKEWNSKILIEIFVILGHLLCYSHIPLFFFTVIATSYPALYVGPETVPQSNFQIQARNHQPTNARQLLVTSGGGGHLSLGREPWAFLKCRNLPEPKLLKAACDRI